MQKQTEFKFEVFSPKIGKIRTYEFNFTNKHLLVIGNNEVKCKYIDSKIEPIWTGGLNKNPLVQMLENDNVFPPSNFIKAIEMAWIDWIKENLSDENLESAIQYLVEWLNFITKTKPGNDYWADKF